MATTPTPYQPRLTPVPTTGEPTPEQGYTLQNALRANIVDVYTNIPIVSGRLVALVGGELVYYDAGNAGHAHALLGLALSSAIEGGIVRVQARGGAYLAEWDFVPDRVYYAGKAGELVDHRPTDTVFLHMIGRAISTEILYMNSKPITFL